MSRILFAVARGARIGNHYSDPAVSGPVVWVETIFACTAFGDLQSIHPDDEYLQYGPISTELRKMAADDSWNPSFQRVLAVAAANAFRVYFGGSRENYPLFYLILAEFLADEGM